MFDPATGRAQLDPVPQPEPEHQRKITREKWFEILSVVILIVGGTAYLAWRNSQVHAPEVSAVESVQAAVELLGSRGYAPADTGRAQDRQYTTFHKSLSAFETHVDLYGVGPEAPMETAVVWLSPKDARVAAGESDLQSAVNEVANVASVLVPTAGEALRKAISTSELMSPEGRRAYDRGVVGTSDGWKLTYATYRSYDESATAEPVLYLVLQSLSAGEDPALAEFNRRLYRAIEEGVEVKSVLRAG